jgi:hypothetical protein
MKIFEISANQSILLALATMLNIAGHTKCRLTLDPMGKFSNTFFSETTNMIKAKLYMGFIGWSSTHIRFFVPI